MENWWVWGFGLYVYQLPLILYTVWVTMAVWDIARRDDMADKQKVGWLIATLVLPVVGPIAYYAAGRSPLSAAFRFGLVGGSFVVYVALALLMVWAAPA